MSEPSNALPRWRTLCTNAKNPRESGSCSWEMPRCGRRPLRHNDHKPSIVLPCPAQKPSPSSSPASSPRPWLTLFCAEPHRSRRASMLSSSVSIRVPDAMGSLMHGSLVCCCTCATMRNDDLPPAFHHAQDRRCCLRHHASAGWAFASTAAALPSLTLAYLGLSLLARHYLGFIALDLVGERHGGLFFTIPPRHSVVLCYTSLSLTDPAWALCALNTCSPIQYRHTIHPFRGG